METNDNIAGVNNQQQTSITNKSYARNARLLRSSLSPSELIETFCPICGATRRKFLFEDAEFPVWKCRECGHMYVSPQPTDAALAEFYTKRYLPETEDENVFEENRVGPYDAVAKAVAEFMPQRGSLLDVGSGFGGFLDRAAKDGWKLFGIEPNVSACAVCHRRLGNNVHIYQGAFEEVDMPESSFDCIVMINVIEHVRHPLNICERAFNLLRSGGCLALRWPQYVLRRKLHAPSHLHGFTRHSMEMLFMKTGFTQVKEYWSSPQSYRTHGFKLYCEATIVRLAARVFFTATFSKRQIPFVARLTLARKP